MLEYLDLHGESLRLATEKPRAWEFLLFAHVILDEIESSNTKSMHSLQSLGSADSPHITFVGFGEWAVARLNDLAVLATQLANVVVGKHENAFGPTGQPGNVSEIVRLSRQITAYNDKALDWSLAILSTQVDSRCRDITDDLSTFASAITLGIKKFAQQIITQVESLSNIPSEAHPNSVAFSLVLEAPDTTSLLNRIQQLTRETQLMSQQATDSSRAGYLYLLINPSMEGLVKIGKTTRNPKERAKELRAATGVPTHFILVFDVSVSDCSRAEQYVHSRLEEQNCRVSSRREFFRVSPNEAVKIMLEAQALINGE